MDSFLISFHNVLWDNLFISEVGLRDSFPNEKILSSPPSEWNESGYTKIDTVFHDYGEHLHQYIYGDGISRLWEENNKRTCFFPWNIACSSWNSAKLALLSPIHKIVIAAGKNKKRNIGLKIQVSSDYVKWKTLYTISNFDAKRMEKAALEIFFFDDTKYLYVRVFRENSTNGYDIESIKIYARNSEFKSTNTQHTIFYVLNGSMNVNGVKHATPFGLLRLNTDSSALTVSEENNVKVFWITFSGTDSVNLLEKANFDFSSPFFNIRHKSYFQEINNFVNEQISTEDENQFSLISKFMALLALHSKYYGITDRLENHGESLQEKYIILALQYIDNNKYAGITLADIAKQCSISEKYLIKIFKESLGITPILYLNNCKIHEAKKLLRKTNKSISVISQQFRFSSPEYFCRMFKKHEGCSPTQYRKIKRAEAEKNNS